MIEEEIPAALGGERLDRIVSLITDCSRSDAAALVAAGGAAIDGEVQHIGKLRVRTGQVVSVDPAMLPVTAPPAADDTVEFRVVHADEHLIIIDKPAGLVVPPGAGHPDHTLVNGLLAVARTQRAYHSLVDALAARDVGRVYRALVWGHLANPVGVVDAPIGRDHRDAMRMAVVVDGKPARTRYRVLREYRTPTESSALECRLETGRTHQIRVHLAAIGHPVVGDGAYGGIRTGITPPRPFLHAAALELVHPVTGEVLQFHSPLPADLADVEAALGT